MDDPVHMRDGLVDEGSVLDVSEDEVGAVWSLVDADMAVEDGEDVSTLLGLLYDIPTDEPVPARDEDVLHDFTIQKLPGLTPSLNEAKAFLRARGSLFMAW